MTSLSLVGLSPWATQDHDRTVLHLLYCLSEHNLKLNVDKIKFRTPTAPSDMASTCRFPGIITYLSKFCPYLSEEVRPLCDLTHIKHDFL